MSIYFNETHDIGLIVDWLNGLMVEWFIGLIVDWTNG